MTLSVEVTMTLGVVVSSDIECGGLYLHWVLWSQVTLSVEVSSDIECFGLY